ncbi:MAG: porin, partial [Polaromonas sp.]
LSLVATAVLGLISTTAMAQSTVTLYGIVDGGYNYVSGLRQGSINTIASGIMEGSRFGLRGNEDIGGGYRAIFTLENRLELDTGAVSNRPNSGTQVPDRIANSVVAGVLGAGLPLPSATLNALVPAVVGGVNTNLATEAFGVNVGANGNRLFDRQAFVGLVTPFGAFTLGRQYTPGYLASATFDASQTQSSLAAGQVASLPSAFDIRLSNTLQYGIKVDGVTATLMYGAGEVAGDSQKSRFLGLMAIYKASNFSAGFGHNQKKNELGQSSLTNNVFGATLDVGPGTVYGQYATIKDNNPSGISTVGAGAAAAAIANGVPAALRPALTNAFQNSYNAAFRQDARLMHIGYKITTGPHTIVTAFNRLDDKRLVNADTDSYGVTYTYALSKRTNLNTVLTRFNNKGQGQVAPGGNGFLGGVTSAAGVGSTNLALGIRHTF